MQKPAPAENERPDPGLDSFLDPRLGLTGLTTAAGTVAGGASLVGYLGTVSWWFDLASHFRVQYFLGLLAVAAFLALLKRFRIAAVFALLAGLNLYSIASVYTLAVTSIHGERLRLMATNVYTANDHFDAVVDEIRRFSPDVVLVEEVDDDWMAVLDNALTEYPHRLARPRQDNFGIALFSRLPFVDAELLDIGGSRVPSVRAVVRVNDRDVTLIGTHTIPPVSRFGARRRNVHLAALAEMARATEGPVVVLGDLNVSPWSPFMARLLRDGGLRTAAYGVRPTWPVGLWPLRIPIDHCLISKELDRIGFETGSDVGSDHLPIVADVVVPGRGD